jgi:hypothetical protein
MEALEGIPFELHLQCASVTLYLYNPILWGRCTAGWRRVDIGPCSHQPR